MSKATRRWQLAATWLLCAFLIAAYLDKLPDPPAVTPHGNAAKAAYLIDHREGSLNQGYTWDRFRNRIRSRPVRSLRDADASSFRFLSSGPGPLNFIRVRPGRSNSTR